MQRPLVATILQNVITDKNIRNLPCMRRINSSKTHAGD